MSNAASLYVKKLVLAPRECLCGNRRHGKQQLAAQEKTVLWYLGDAHSEEAGIAWPSIGELARCSGGLSSRRTQEILAGLICKGVIGRQVRLRANGSNSSNGYYFPAIDGLKPEAVDVDGKRARPRKKSTEQLVDSLFDAAECRRVGCDTSQGEDATHRTLGCDASQGEGATHRTPKNLPVEAPSEAPLEAPREANHPQTPPQAEGRRSRKARFAEDAERQIDAVMQACGFSDGRLRRPIGEQLELERNKGQPLPTTALGMIAAWRRFIVQDERLGAKWGPAKFFSQGHWRDDRGWHWDPKAMERDRLMAEARAGSRVQ